MKIFVLLLYLIVQYVPYWTVISAIVAISEISAEKQTLFEFDYGIIILFIFLFCLPFLVSIFMLINDKVLHFMYGFRPPTLAEEKIIKDARLREVLEKSGTKIHYLLVSDEEGLNAWAYGNRTVVFTSDILLNKDVTLEMLQGIAGHEAGHIEHGDSTIQAVLYSFSICRVWAIQACLIFSEKFLKITQAVLPPLIAGMLSLFVVGLVLLPIICFSIVIWMSDVVQCFVSRSQEYSADKYAVKMGYGKGLYAFMQSMQGGALSNKIEKGFMSNILISRIIDTHPSWPKRMEAVQNMSEFDDSWVVHNES